VSTHEPLRIDRRKAILTGIAAAALAVAAVALIGQFAHFDEMMRSLRRADGSWFPICLGGEILAYAGYIAAYRDVARADGGPQLSFWTSTRVIAIGFGAFLAASSAATLGTDYWALHRTGEKPHEAARRVLALNTLEWGILASFAALAGALTLAGVGDAPQAMALGWLIVVPACIAAAVWVSSPRRAESLAALPRGHPSIERDPRTWPRWLWHAARAGLADAIGGVVLVRHLVVHSRRHFHSLIGFFVYWGGDILTLYAALRAFGVHVGLVPLVLAYTTAYVVTSLPLPAGGAGGVEAGLAFSLHAIGVPLAPALLATLVYRFFTLWLPIAPALLFLPQLPKLADELPRVERAAEYA
jgi:uncharacterized membrane protein YbhN (UPF0104 family)